MKRADLNKYSQLLIETEGQVLTCDLKISPKENIWIAYMPSKTITAGVPLKPLTLTDELIVRIVERADGTIFLKL
jgi:hypothetical protein